MSAAKKIKALRDDFKGEAHDLDSEIAEAVKYNDFAKAQHLLSTKDTLLYVIHRLEH